MLSDGSQQNVFPLTLKFQENGKFCDFFLCTCGTKNVKDGTLCGFDLVNCYFKTVTSGHSCGWS